MFVLKSSYPAFNCCVNPPLFLFQLAPNPTFILLLIELDTNVEPLDSIPPASPPANASEFHPSGPSAFIFPFYMPRLPRPPTP